MRKIESGRHRENVDLGGHNVCILEILASSSRAAAAAANNSEEGQGQNRTVDNWIARMSRSRTMAL